MLLQETCILLNVYIDTYNIHHIWVPWEMYYGEGSGNFQRSLLKLINSIWQAWTNISKCIQLKLSVQKDHPYKLIAIRISEHSTTSLHTDFISRGHSFDNTSIFHEGHKQ